MTIQRYSLTIEPDDSAYLEPDPAGYWCVANEAELAVMAVRIRLHERVADYFMRRHEMDPHTIASDVLYIVGEEKL